MAKTAQTPKQTPDSAQSGIKIVPEGQRVTLLEYCRVAIQQAKSDNPKATGILKRELLSAISDAIRVQGLKNLEQIKAAKFGEFQGHTAALEILIANGSLAQTFSRVSEKTGKKYAIVCLPEDARNSSNKIFKALGW